MSPCTSSPHLFYRIAAHILDVYLSRNRLFLVMRQGGGLGEQVAMTAVPESLPEGMRAIVVTDFPEFFQDHPRVARIIDLTIASGFWRRKLSRLTKIGGERFFYFDYFSDRFANHFEELRETGEVRHLIRLNTEHAQRAEWFREFNGPRIHLAPEEVCAVGGKYGLPSTYFTIHSEGKTDWTPNKEVGSEKMQALADALQEKTGFRAVQVGMSDDRVLSNVNNICGKPDLRDLAAIFSRARFSVSQEGFFTHLSAAVGTRNFTVLTGVISIELSGYREVVPLSLEPQVVCAPCWRQHRCPLDDFPCSTGLEPEVLALLIFRHLSQEGLLEDRETLKVYGPN